MMREQGSVRATIALLRNHVSILGEERGEEENNASGLERLSRTIFGVSSSGDIRKFGGDWLLHILNVGRKQAASPTVQCRSEAGRLSDSSMQ
jgi:hypothetical protein